MEGAASPWAAGLAEVAAVAAAGRRHGWAGDGGSWARLPAATDTGRRQADQRAAAEDTCTASEATGRRREKGKRDFAGGRAARPYYWRAVDATGAAAMTRREEGGRGACRLQATATAAAQWDGGSYAGRSLV